MSQARWQRRVSVEPTNRWILVRAPLRVIWIAFENVIGLAFYVSALILCRPLSYFLPHLYWKIDEYLVWLGMHYISYWMRSPCPRVTISGDSLEPYINEPCLVLVNHQTDADPLICMVAWRNLQIGGRVSVVLEDIFHCTHFGVMMNLRGDFFIHQGRDQRHLQAAMIQDHLRRYERLRDPRWCVVFPEGGFLQKRKQRNLDYAKKNGYPILENVLLPRLGAVQALLCAERNGDDESSDIVKNGDAFHARPNRSFFRHLIDVTIAYPDRKAVSLAQMLLATCPISHIAVHFRVKKLDRLESYDEKHLRPFMYDLWTEKDQLLQKFYDTGAFADASFEDVLKINYMSHVKGYGLVIPTLIFYAYCISMFLNYFWIFVIWIVRFLINLLF